MIKTKILVIEEETASRHVLVEGLRTKGYEVVAAQSGGEGPPIIFEDQ